MVEFMYRGDYEDGTEEVGAENLEVEPENGEVKPSNEGKGCYSAVVDQIR